jgi:hypothetical protein
MIGMTSGVARQRSNSTQPPCRHRNTSAAASALQRECTFPPVSWPPGLLSPRSLLPLHLHSERRLRCGGGLDTCTRGVGCGATGKDEDAEVGSKGVGQDSLGAARELGTANALCVMKTKSGGMVGDKSCRRFTWPRTFWSLLVPSIFKFTASSVSHGAHPPIVPPQLSSTKKKSRGKQRHVRV